MTIHELCIKYNCDKCPEVHHGYADYYDELFKDKKNARRVLEIGIGYPKLMTHVPNYILGASLFVWRDYFKDATIYAIDINPGCMFKDNRIKTFLLDQDEESHMNDLITMIGNFDIVIDDGSHNWKHQVFTAKQLLPYLNQGGIYVIEDVSRAEDVMRELGEGELVVFDRAKGDDNLIIIRR